MMNKYELDAIHNGTGCGDFCLYQTYDGQMDDIRPLVWFSKTAHPGTRLAFEWGIDYSIAWSEQGVLTPGVVFRAAQDKDTSPNRAFNDTNSSPQKENPAGFSSTEPSP